MELGRYIIEHDKLRRAVNDLNENQSDKMPNDVHQDYFDDDSQEDKYHL